jgi:predicted RNA binding protein YcfA (HicA-like mRNA interferase family)
MIKRRDLIRHLEANGCVLLRQGGNHEIWRNRWRKRRAPVPRHRQIPSATAKSICRLLGIPDP